MTRYHNWTVAGLLKRVDDLEIALEPFAALETAIHHKTDHWLVEVQLKVKDIRRAIECLRESY